MHAFSSSKDFRDIHICLLLPGQEGNCHCLNVLLMQGKADNYAPAVVGSWQVVAWN